MYNHILVAAIIIKKKSHNSLLQHNSGYYHITTLTTQNTDTILNDHVPQLWQIVSAVTFY